MSGVWSLKEEGTKHEVVYPLPRCQLSMDLFGNGIAGVGEPILMGTQPQAHNMWKKAPIETDFSPNSWNVFEPHKEKLELGSR